MTHSEQKRFIRALIKNVQHDIVSNVPKHPTTWDGIELRWLIREKFR